MIENNQNNSNIGVFNTERTNPSGNMGTPLPTRNVDTQIPAGNMGNQTPTGSMGMPQPTGNTNAPTSNGTMGNPIPARNVETPMSNGNMGSAPNINNSNQVVQKRSNKKEILIVVGLIITILVVAAVFYFLYFGQKNVYVKTTDIIFKNLGNMINSGVNIADQSYLYAGNINVDSNMEELDFLKAADINYTLGVDIKNKKAEASIKYLENDNKKMAYSAYVKENNAYINLHEVFEKIILIDDEAFKEETSMTIDELFDQIEKSFSKENMENTEYVLQSFHKITTKALNNIKYEETKEKIDINGKSVSTNKTTLNLTKENIQTLASTYIDEMLKDAKLIDKLALLLEIEGTDLTESLNDAKESIADIEGPSTPSKISIYTSGLLGKIVKVEITSGEETVRYIDYKDYKLIEADGFIFEINNKALTIKVNDKVVATGTVESLEADNINFNFKSAENDMITGKVIYTKNKTKVNFNINVEVSDDEKITIDLSGNIEVASDKESNYKYVLSMKSGDEQIKVTNNTKLLVGEEIAPNVPSNTVNYKDLTNDDLTTIEQNFKKQLKNTTFGDTIEQAEKMEFSLNAGAALQNAIEEYQRALITGDYSKFTKESSSSYCISLINLDQTNSSNLYMGTVTIIEDSMNPYSYTYQIEMYNGDYYTIAKNQVNQTDIHDIQDMPSTIKRSCGLPLVVE